jgi:hypothetical protein
MEQTTSRYEGSQAITHGQPIRDGPQTGVVGDGLIMPHRKKKYYTGYQQSNDTSGLIGGEEFLE